MMTKDWLLKPESIKIAKECIKHVQSELDVKLLLSHPTFLEMLNDYSDLLSNDELTNAVNQLNEIAGIKSQSTAKVVNHPNAKTSVRNIDSTETINHRGKNYLRWRGDKEFAGLYRGQPRCS